MSLQFQFALNTKHDYDKMLVKAYYSNALFFRSQDLRSLEDY